MRLRRVGVAGLAILVCGVVAAIVMTGHRAPASVRSKSSLPTVTVRRGDLQQAQLVTGQLGYGPSWAVAGHSAGVITWLPAVAAKVSRGQQLYRVDDVPVTLFYGDLPLYRTLRYTPPKPAKHDSKSSAPDVQPATPTIQTGHDVDLVAANLAALGFYDGVTTGAQYAGVLVEAVEAWQRSIGAAVTGVISPGDVVVTNGPVRISGVLAHVDDQAAEEVLTVTGVAKLVTLQLPSGVARSLSVVRMLWVTLSSGTRIRARVFRIGTPVAGSQAGVPVTVRALHPRVLDHAGVGTVTANVVTASRPHVLYLPITALLALSGGGYAVERPNHALVPVHLGMITDGDVQVSGIGAGAKVVVAQ